MPQLNFFVLRVLDESLFPLLENMDYLSDENANLRRTRSFLAILGATDFAFAFASVMLHIVRSSGHGLSAGALIYAIILTLHFLSGAFALAVAFTGIDIPFVLTSVAISVFILLIDIVVLLFRWILDLPDSKWFIIVTHAHHVLWAMVTLGEIFLLSVYLGALARWKRKLGFLWKRTKLSYKQINGQFDVPKKVMIARRWLDFLWIADLVLMFFFLLIFTPGFLSGATMGWLALATLPHLFQWIWVRAILGSDVRGAITKPDNFLLALTQCLVAVATVLDLGSAILRTVLLANGTNWENTPYVVVYIGEPVTVVFATISTVTVYLLAIVGLLYNIFFARLVAGLRQHREKRLREKQTIKAKAA